MMAWNIRKMSSSGEVENVLVRLSWIG